ncbi:cell adhesion molecule 3-like [Xenentodon cancila]
MLESRRFTLQCDVQNAAPLKDLNVTFYKGLTVLGHLKSTKTTKEEKEPANEQFTLDFSASKEDDGIQFWCEARLELGPDGPRIPPVVKSEKLTATVHYGPKLKHSANPDTIAIMKGESLRLICSAEGNPAPSYKWTRPSGSSSHSSSVLTVESVGFGDKGQYTCTVGNSVESVQVNFTVDVQDNSTLYVVFGIIAGVVVIGGVLLGYICYRRRR